MTVYIVTLERPLTSLEQTEVTVEAGSPEEAAELALEDCRPGDLTWKEVEGDPDLGEIRAVKIEPLCEGDELRLAKL